MLPGHAETLEGLIAKDRHAVPFVHALRVWHPTVPQLHLAVVADGVTGAVLRATPTKGSLDSYLLQPPTLTFAEREALQTFVMEALRRAGRIK